MLKCGVKLLQCATFIVPVTTIVHDQHGPSRYILNTCGASAFEAFKIFLTDDVVKTTVNCRNLEGTLQTDEWRSTDENEIHCLFDLLLLIGAYRNKNVSISELWSEKDGIPLYNRAMSCKRFTSLPRCLRFDKRADRNVCLISLLPSEMFSKWLCQNSVLHTDQVSV